MLTHSETMKSWIDLKDVTEIKDFKQIQIIAKLSTMTSRDLKCYRLHWKLIMISKKSISFYELLMAKGTSEKRNSSASIGIITFEEAFWFSGFTKIS